MTCTTLNCPACSTTSLSDCCSMREELLTRRRERQWQTGQPSRHSISLLQKLWADQLMGRLEVCTCNLDYTYPLSVFLGECQGSNPLFSFQKVFMPHLLQLTLIFLTSFAPISLLISLSLHPPWPVFWPERNPDPDLRLNLICFPQSWGFCDNTTKTLPIYTIKHCYSKQKLSPFAP